MADVTRILALLNDRSQNQKLVWRTTVRPGTFVTTLGEVSVAVRSVQIGIDDVHFELEILDKLGRTVEILTTGFGLFAEPDPKARQHSVLLKRLFELARRSALDVDSTLEELARELDAIE